MALKCCSFITAISFFVSMFSGNAARVPFPLQNLSKPTTKDYNFTDLESVSAGYSYVISLYPFVAQTWNGECFQNNYGYVSYNIDGSTGFITIDPSNPKSTFCWDYYQFKVGDQIIGTDSIYSQWTSHETLFDGTDQELKKQIKANGVAVYMQKSGLNVGRNQNEQAFEERPQPRRVNDVIDVDDAHPEEKGYSAA